MRVRGSRPRHGLVNGTTKTLQQVILSDTEFQFYGLGVYCKPPPPRLRWPPCIARTHCLPPSSHLRHSNVLCRRLPIPLHSLCVPAPPPVPSPPLQCRSLHFDQSDAIQLITFSTECLSRRRRRREPLRCPSSGTQRAPGTDASGCHTSNSAALLRCSPLIPSARPSAVAPSLITAHSVPDHRSSGRSKWQQVIKQERWQLGM